MKKTLDDWLRWQETLHLSEIDLGLERIGKVAEKLDLLTPKFPIITVAGTNGKGSTVAFLEAILRAAGYRTGAFTSPHLSRYNERITLSGTQATDAQIIEAFSTIDKARRELPNSETVSLTYFEFSTLAAMLIYQQQAVDVAILEVGLGGRLDAANLWDASLAIITSIGVDHVDWLGDDREQIGVEKAGIMRANTPVVCGDLAPPASIAHEAQRHGAQLLQINQDFTYKKPTNTTEQTWHWSNHDTDLHLPLPSMSGAFQLNNAATAIAGLLAIQQQLPITPKAINAGLKNATVTGRLQRIHHQPEWIMDVAHNPHAAKQLAQYLQQHPTTGKTYALFSMLRDKDVAAVIAALNPEIDEWHIVATEGSRGLTVTELEHYFTKLPIDDEQKQTTHTPSHIVSHVVSYNDFSHAYKALKNIAKAQDRVVAFGSFLVISELLNCIR